MRSDIIGVDTLTKELMYLFTIPAVEGQTDYSAEFFQDSYFDAVRKNFTKLVLRKVNLDGSISVSSYSSFDFSDIFSLLPGSTMNQSNYLAFVKENFSLFDEFNGNSNCVPSHVSVRPVASGNFGIKLPFVPDGDLSSVDFYFVCAVAKASDFYGRGFADLRYYPSLQLDY